MNLWLAVGAYCVMIVCFCVALFFWMEDSGAYDEHREEEER